MKWPKWKSHAHEDIERQLFEAKQETDNLKRRVHTLEVEAGIVSRPQLRKLNGGTT